MKKTYTKPEISFESFLMSANIAADCEVKPNTQNNYNSCAHKLTGANLFFFGTDLTGCNNYGDYDRQVAPYGEANGICYHTPSDNNNIFNS